MLPTCRFGRYRPCRVGWACGSARKESPCCVCRPAVTPFDPSNARSPGLPAWRWRFAGAAAGLPAGRPAWRSGTPSGRRWPSFPSSTGWCSKRRTSPADVGYLKEQGSTPFAYLSVGEFDGDAAAIADSGLARGKSAVRNEAWNSQVMDLAAPRRAHLLKRAAGCANRATPACSSIPWTASSYRPRRREASAGRWPVSPSCIARSRASSCFSIAVSKCCRVVRRRVGGGRGVDPCRLGRRCRAIPRGAPGRSRLAEGSPGCPARPGHAHRRHRLPAAGAARRRARSLRACVAKATCRSSAPRRWTTWGERRRGATAAHRAALRSARGAT